MSDINALAERCGKAANHVDDGIDDLLLEVAAALLALRDERDVTERDYQRIIREVLKCDPQPASERTHDDQLEPPWEVIARIRAERDALRDRVGEMGQYTRHRSNCAQRITGIPSDDGGCTCGLDSLLAAIAAST